MSFHGARYFPLLLLVSHHQLANGPSIVRACKENIILFSHQPPEVGGKLKLFNLLFNIRTDSFKSRHRQTHYPQAIYTIHRPTHYLHRLSHYPHAYTVSTGSRPILPWAILVYMQACLLLPTPLDPVKKSSKVKSCCLRKHSD